MRAPISVVIACTDAQDHLPRQMAALAEGLAEGLIRELIVVDGGSTDSTVAMATEAGAKVLAGPSEMIAAQRLGAASATGEWLLFGAAGSALAEGWTGQVFRHLERTPDMAGALPALRVVRSRWRPLAPRPARWLLVPQGLYLVAASAGGGVRGPLRLEQQLRGRLVRR